MSEVYQPDLTIIRRYAEVLVNFALNSGAGLKSGEVVDCVVPDVAKIMALELQNVILEAGGHPMVRLVPTGLERDFYERANAEQLTFFPKKYLKARADLIHHQIGIIADVDPYELQDIDPAKIILARDSKKTYREWLVAKENRGAFTWTLGLWGVESKAGVVGLSLEQYWEQIIQACLLDKENPVAEWQKLSALQKEILAKLNSLSINYLQVEGPDVQLKVTLGAERCWQGGSGRNIPSFEMFTSPDWRGMEGWIRFNQPVYRYGQVMSGVYLEFKKGRVVKAEAENGNQLLQQMLKSPHADKAGEFSLTDKRMSRITHVMAETLFDENIGGPFGNTHLALGSAYKDCYRGDPSKVSKQQWKKMGYNDSAEHTDIVSTTDRTVTAHMVDGTSQVIYKDGQFIL